MPDEASRPPPALPPETAAAPPAAPVTAASEPGLPAARLETPKRSSRRPLVGAAKAIFGWPRGHWPAPTVTVLLATAVVVVGAVELLPRAISDVTLSVRARTEVLEIDLDPLRTYVWWLPGGSYSLLTAKAGAGCELRDRFDVVCPYADPTALTIKNGATVRFEVAPPEATGGALHFNAAIMPRARAAAPQASSGGLTPTVAAAAVKQPEPSAFEVRGAADEPLLETHDLVTFESGPVDLWRIPLILRRVQVGESLSESVSTDSLGPVRQPIMTEGDVRIYARGLGSQDRYEIQQERFDPADVVQIPADPADSGLLLGVLSLDRSDRRHAFDVTMHTALAEVFVRRLGAGHRIGVSMWSIVSQLPTWAALWVVWVSLIVVANYHAARLQQLQGEHHVESKPA